MRIAARVNITVASFNHFLFNLEGSIAVGDCAKCCVPSAISAHGLCVHLLCASCHLLTSTAVMFAPPASIISVIGAKLTLSSMRNLHCAVPLLLVIVVQGKFVCQDKCNRATLHPF